MKNLLFGLIAIVMFSFNGFASTSLVKNENKIITSKVIVVSNKTTEIVGDCTACATVTVGLVSVQVCKTEKTCKAEIKALLAEL